MLSSACLVGSWNWALSSERVDQSVNSEPVLFRMKINENYLNLFYIQYYVLYIKIAIRIKYILGFFL